ncbi:MAG: carbohydrate ABC transporter permease [Massiliimalia sp.]|jgi:ABC-type sugar transport system permease subunit
MSQVQTRKKFKFRKVKPYLFISPFFILYTIFGLYPLLSGMVMSLESKGAFVGFSNYQEVLTDSRFWKAISNAALYTCGSVFIILPVALGAAVMLNSALMGKKRGTMSTVFFIPNVTSVLVVGIVFKYILKTNGGILNELLQAVGLIDKNIRFLNDPKWAVVSLVIIGTWRYFGVNSLYFLSGLQGISSDLGEAARIDGANAWQEFWRIKFPLLKPIMVYVVFTAITGSFAMFGEVYTLVGAGSTGARDSMLYPVIYLYNTMFRDNKMNEAATMGYVLAVILLIITSIQRYIMRDKD